MMRWIIGVVLGLASACASAAEWRLSAEVGRTTADTVYICQLWGADIYAPGEAVTCRVGTIYVVDVESGDIRYHHKGIQGLPDSKQERDTNRDALAYALKGEGFAKLEKLRAEVLERKAAAQAAADSEKKRARYLADYNEATSLEKIKAFEEKYANNDPDGLIAELASVRSNLQHESYRSAFTNASTSAALGKFIEEYQANDPDGLVSEARKRRDILARQEALAQRQAEKQRAEEARQQARQAQQAVADKKQARLDNISKLRAKYGQLVQADTAEGYQIVSQFKIDCRAPDRRVLPLMNALYISAAEIAHMGGQMTFHIQNRGKTVRIYGDSKREGKPVGSPVLYFEINEWGELRAVAIQNDAVLNSCYGSYGPIWLMPGEPGY